MLLGPPLAARALVRTFWPMAAWAATLGALGGLGGLYLSWHADVGGGPAIVLVVALGCALAALAGRARSAAPVGGGRAGTGQPA
jgi:ABC-type Mn2+/Zn2+ transport system permease subunit